MLTHGESVTLTILNRNGTSTSHALKAMVHGQAQFDTDRGSSFTGYDFVFYSVTTDATLNGIDPSDLNPGMADVAWNSKYYRFDGTITEETPFSFIGSFQEHRQPLRHGRGEQ